MMNHHWFIPFKLVLAVLILALTVSIVQATESLPSPEGRVILEITGAIDKTNIMNKARFDHKMLEAIGFSELQTSTPWTEGIPIFKGILIRKLLDYVGAQGESVLAVALNDYKVEIPISDFRDYPVILASTMDGVRLKVRDKGPLWIIYPVDQYQELKVVEVQSRWVWQVKELRVQ